MKSASDSAPRPNKWRLKKTLKRATDFRPIENDDLRYIFAAYKKGALVTMGEPFLDTSMDAETFRQTFEQFVLDRFHAVWTLFATTKKGLIPVGVVFASSAPCVPYLIVNNMCWFPWASCRNIVEASVSFLNAIRKQFNLMFYALPQHKRTYEVCAMHGIVRRIGTSYNVIPGVSAAVFETRSA